MEYFYISESNHEQISEPTPSSSLKFNITLGEKSFGMALRQLLGGNSSHAALFYNGTSKKISGECFIDSLSYNSCTEVDIYNAVLTFCGPITYEIKQ
jgi:hypothetical protein